MNGATEICPLVRLESRFSISPGNMHLWAGTSLADVRLRIDMFGGRGQIEVAVDKLSIDFDNLKTASDIAICQDCVAASEQTIQGFWPDMNFAFSFVNLNYTVELGDGIESARDYLSQLTVPKISLDLADIQGAVERPSIRLDIENEKEKWDVSISSERRVGGKKSIFVSIIATFHGDSTVHGAKNRIDLANRLIDLYFKGIGLNVST